MIRIVASFEVNAAVERVVTLTNDAVNLPAWLTGVTSAEVLAEEGDIRVVELCGPRLRGGRLVLECVQVSEQELLFAEVDRYRGRGFSGSFSVQPNGGGEGCVLRVAVQQDGLPFNLVSRRRLRNTLNELAAVLARRAENVTAPVIDITVRRRKILEIVRREGRLFVCVEGTSVELPSAGEPGGSS